MEALLHICHFRRPDLGYFRGQFTNESIIKTIKAIAPSFTDTLNKCEWQNKEYLCSELFRTVMTDEGQCFQFNGLNAHEIFTDQ